jgi:hypothetical protein
MTDGSFLNTNAVTCFVFFYPEEEQQQQGNTATTTTSSASSSIIYTSVVPIPRKGTRLLSD